MKTLIVEDEFIIRRLLQDILSSYGPVHVAVNGKEAIEAVSDAIKAGDPYNLICMDIIMPEIDGQKALKQIREQEEARGILLSMGVKIVMITALSDREHIYSSFYDLCDAYLMKPIQKNKLLETLRKLELIS
jgi:two-component system chemotaxis response regulator CheY